MVDVGGPLLTRARTIWTRVCASRILPVVELMEKQAPIATHGAASLLAERRARRGARGREMRRVARNHRARLRRGGSPGRWDHPCGSMALVET